MERSPELGVWERARRGPWAQTLQIICIKCSVCLNAVFLQGDTAGLWSEILPGRMGSPPFAGHVTFQALDPSCNTHTLQSCCNRHPPTPSFPMVSKGTDGLLRTTVRGSRAETGPLLSFLLPPSGLCTQTWSHQLRAQSPLLPADPGPPR